MEEEYKKVVLCSGSGCKVADLCHRAMGYKTITKEDRYLRVVNPLVITNDKDCPMFSGKKKVRYGCGFMNMERNLPRAVFESMKSELLARYTKNPYYEMRKGTRLISPDVQQFFAELFEAQGIEPYPFDSYVEKEEWG